MDRCMYCEAENDTVAIRTTATQYGLKHTVWSMASEAPSAATRYCKPCAVALITDLINTLA